MPLGTYAGGDPHIMAQLVSRGSGGCIAAMEQMNPRMYIDGEVQWEGVALIIRWDWIICECRNKPQT